LWIPLDKEDIYLVVTGYFIPAKGGIADSKLAAFSVLRGVGAPVPEKK
jgi:hypothetical protein